jgi:DNA-binding XRE family transcriptional regulator
MLYEEPDPQHAISLQRLDSMPKRHPDTGEDPSYRPDQPIWPLPDKHVASKAVQPPKRPGERRGSGTPADLQIVFGENLKAARMRLDISQRQLSELTGLTQQYLSLVETGQKNLTLRTMMTLARVVGANVSEMLRPDSQR